MTKRIRIAVVGFGLIGKRHAQILRDLPKHELAAVVDPVAQNRSDAALLGCPTFASLEQMFDAITPDGVILATPTPLHMEQGLCCIAANCPVLIEKPITVTSDEARRLTDAAIRADVALLVGHHRRHNGMVQAAKSALKDGMIGDIRSVQATCWFYKPDHYFAAAPWRTKSGAGPVSVNLVHDVDLLRHFCGEVASVYAVSRPSHRGFENEDVASAILTFHSGTVATISVSDSIVAPWSWELTSRENAAYPATGESCYLIGGSKGALSLPDLRIWQHGSEPDWWTPITATSLICPTNDPLVMQLEHFARVIRNEETPLVSGQEGARSLEVVEAVAISAQSGEVVKVRR